MKQLHCVEDFLYLGCEKSIYYINIGGNLTLTFFFAYIFTLYQKSLQYFVLVAYSSECVYDMTVKLVRLKLISDSRSDIMLAV